MTLMGAVEYEEWRQGRSGQLHEPPVQLPPKSLRGTQATHRKVGPASVCRLCLRPYSVRPLTRHHLVPDHWFRSHPDRLIRAIRNAHANIVPLCRQCHDLIESRDEEERATARRYLRRSLTQQEVAFMIAVRGKAWLDLAYPVSQSGSGVTGSPPST